MHLIEGEHISCGSRKLKQICIIYWCIQPCLDQENWNLLPVYAAAAYRIHCIPLIVIIGEILYKLLVTLWNSEWPILTIQWTLQPCWRERQGNWSQPLVIAHKGSTGRSESSTRVNWASSCPPPSHHPLSGQSQVITPPYPLPTSDGSAHRQYMLDDLHRDSTKL